MTDDERTRNCEVCRKRIDEDKGVYVFDPRIHTEIQTFCPKCYIKHKDRLPAGVAERS